MRILILGSGGREHAFAWKLAQSPKCEKIFVAPGNAGTNQVAINVNIPISDFEAIDDFIKEQQISMLVVGPEDPLVNGIRDFLESRHPNLIIVGPNKNGAQLEGSKDFTKDFLLRHKIPTATYATFTSENFEEGVEYLKNHKLPIVLKADGLAAGKGVVICANNEDAVSEFTQMIKESKFGNASSKVVVEQFLRGIELSVFVLLDGKNYVVLPEAKDYKRIGEGDKGLNTGGMGAISPVPFATPAFLEKVEQKIIIPSVQGLKKDGIDYKGFLFIGIMNVNNHPYVIEFNVRMGDPETETVLPRIKSDLVDVFEKMHHQKLDEVQFEIDTDFSTTVIMVAGGYPENYKKGKVISGLDKSHEALVFHAGTLEQNGNIVTNGGRVLAVTGKAATMQEALNKSYESAKNIEWENHYYRKDIGFDLLPPVSEIELKVRDLINKIDQNTNKGSFLTKLRNLKEELLQSNVMKDIENLYADILIKEHEIETLISANRERNLEIKKALLEELKIVTSSNKFKEAVEAIKSIRERWNKTGEVAKDYKDTLETEFQELQQQFFDKKDEILAKVKESYANLITEAERVLEEEKENLNEASKKLKALQADWKNLENLPSAVYNELWEKFRAVNNTFFEGFKEEKEKLKEVKKGVFKQTNSEKKIALIEKVKTSTAQNIKEALQVAKSYREQWKTIGPVSDDLHQKLWDDFNFEIEKMIEKTKLNVFGDKTDDKVRHLKNLIRKEEDALNIMNTNLGNFRINHKSEKFSQVLDNKTYQQDVSLKVKKALLNELKANLK